MVVDIWQTQCRYVLDPNGRVTDMNSYIGYARTSTVEQIAGFEAQLTALQQEGCRKVFQEQVSSVGVRPQLTVCLDYLREGDTLVVTKLDRLARNVMHLGDILATLKAKGASLRILDMGIDTSTSTGELILNVMASVAQFERSMMLERQMDGIAKAKAEGKYKGRKPVAMDQASTIRQLASEGLTRAAIAQRLGVSERSVYRALGTTHSRG